MPPAGGKKDFEHFLPLDHAANLLPEAGLPIAPDHRASKALFGLDVYLDFH